MTLRTEQRTIARRVLREMARLWPQLDPERIDETWPPLVALIERVVASEHSVASQVGIAEYLALRGAEGVTSVFLPSPAALALEAVRTSLTVTGPVAMKLAIRRGLPRPQASKLALVQLQGAAARHVLNGVRDTTLAAVAADPEVLGWARIARPGGCAFCVMLSTRGGVYRSKETALTSKSGTAYHDHCGCVTQPIFSETWSPPSYMRRFEELYESSTRDSYGKDKQRAFAVALAQSREKQQMAA